MHISGVRNNFWIIQKLNEDVNNKERRRKKEQFRQDVRDVCVAGMSTQAGLKLLPDGIFVCGAALLIWSYCAHYLLIGKKCIMTVNTSKM